MISVCVCRHGGESQMAADWLSCLLEFCLCRGHVASVLTLLIDVYSKYSTHDSLCCPCVNIIRTIFTKNRRLVAEVCTIHVN